MSQNRNGTRRWFKYSQEETHLSATPGRRTPQSISRKVPLFVEIDVPCAHSPRVIEKRALWRGWGSEKHWKLKRLLRIGCAQIEQYMRTPPSTSIHNKKITMKQKHDGVMFVISNFQRYNVTSKNQCLIWVAGFKTVYNAVWLDG